MSLIIRHSHAEGTLVEGTSRGDGSAEILKEVINPYTGRARAWRWSRQLGSWYVQRSRDNAANSALIEATANALRAAGFEVEIAIDDRYRPPAQVEVDVVARQEARVAALDAKAVRAAAGSEAADARALERTERMPLGQPILVCHHSEGRMRRAYRDIEKASRASVAAYREAQIAQARADTAANTTAVRYSPAVIRRRIGRLVPICGGGSARATGIPAPCTPMPTGSNTSKSPRRPPARASRRPSRRSSAWKAGSDSGSNSSSPPRRRGRKSGQPPTSRSVTRCAAR